MPINAGVEYGLAEKKFNEASTIQDKINALQEMLSKSPNHKGSENLRNEIKRKISKYKSLLEKEKTASKRGSSKFSVKKEGSATICLIGITNSGKSTLLNKLTNAKTEIASYEHTTKKPEIGVMDYNGVKIQVIEIPAITENFMERNDGPGLLGIIRLADLIVIVLDLDKNIHDQLSLMHKELDKAAIKRKIIAIGIKGDKNREFLTTIEKLKNEIWNSLNLIKIYTKQPGKEHEKKPVALRRNSTIRNLAENIHKDFIKKFKFAKIWGKSAKHSGQTAGLQHILKDDDIVEIHLR